MHPMSLLCAARFGARSPQGNSSSTGPWMRRLAILPAHANAHARSAAISASETSYAEKASSSYHSAPPSRVASSSRLNSSRACRAPRDSNSALVYRREAACTSMRSRAAPRSARARTFVPTTSSKARTGPCSVTFGGCQKASLRTSTSHSSLVAGDVTMNRADSGSALICCTLQPRSASPDASAAAISSIGVWLSVATSKSWLSRSTVRAPGRHSRQ